MRPPFTGMLDKMGCRNLLSVLPLEVEYVQLEKRLRKYMEKIYKNFHKMQINSQYGDQSTVKSDIGK
jgi:hypothetical protein